MSKKENGIRVTVIAISLFIVITGLWILTFYLLKGLEPIERGTYGDMFGTINALFSGLAFAGIILTIYLQGKELSLQRDELQQTREELKRTANAQEKSEIALTRQAENLKISAKLSALNSLVNYYSEAEQQLLKINSIHPSLREFQLKKIEYLERIERILELKENN